MIIKLRPSDTSFLWSCKRCFWLRYRHNVFIETIMSQIFNNLAHVQANQVRDKRVEDFIPQLGGGVFAHEEMNVASDPLPVNSEHTFFTGGRFDALADMDDGSVACIDLKSTSSANPDGPSQERKRASIIERYSLQLLAYSYCLRHPASEGFIEEAKPHAPRGTFTRKYYDKGPQKVSGLGLLYYQIVRQTEDTYETVRDFASVPPNETGFIRLVQEMADVIGQDEAPEPRIGIGTGGNQTKGGSCPTCLGFERYAKNFGLTEQLPDRGYQPVFGELLDKSSP